MFTTRFHVWFDDRVLEATTTKKPGPQARRKQESEVDKDHNKPAEPNTKQDIFSESAERLRNFHESANALADRLHTSDIISPTNPNVVEAVKHLYHKLLRKASDDLERVPPL